MKLGEVGKGRACSPEMEFLLTSISLSFHGLRLNVLWRKKKLIAKSGRWPGSLILHFCVLFPIFNLHVYAKIACRR